MAWQKFRVEIKGEPEPIDVQTNALDWATVTVDPAEVHAMDMTFQVVHAALLRVGASIPRDYRGFLEVLEGIPETLEGGDAAALDPTQNDR